MVKRKLFAILVASVLLLSAIAVSAVFCDEGSGDDGFEEFTENTGPGDGAGTCGGGEPGGPGPPQ
jgi:hypothetical protein